MRGKEEMKQNEIPRRHTHLQLLEVVDPSLLPHEDHDVVRMLQI